MESNNRGRPKEDVKRGKEHNVRMHIEFIETRVIVSRNTMFLATEREEASNAIDSGRTDAL